MCRRAAEGLQQKLVREILVMIQKIRKSLSEHANPRPRMPVAKAGKGSNLRFNPGAAEFNPGAPAFMPPYLLRAVLLGTVQFVLEFCTVVADDRVHSVILLSHDIFVLETFTILMLIEVRIHRGRHGMYAQHPPPPSLMDPRTGAVHPYTPYFPGMANMVMVNHPLPQMGGAHGGESSTGKHCVQYKRHAYRTLRTMQTIDK